MPERTPDRTPRQLAEAAAARALAQIAKIPHPRFVATKEEKAHILASLRTAVDTLEYRILTLAEPFSLTPPQLYIWGEAKERGATSEEVEP